MQKKARENRRIQEAARKAQAEETEQRLQEERKEARRKQMAQTKAEKAKQLQNSLTKVNQCGIVIIAVSQIYLGKCKTCRPSTGASSSR